MLLLMAGKTVHLYVLPTIILVICCFAIVEKAKKSSFYRLALINIYLSSVEKISSKWGNPH